jgi:hypothetical protein
MRHNLALETAGIPADTLTSLVEAVKDDPAPVVTFVQASVQRSQKDVNNCMMGGWTS